MAVKLVSLREYSRQRGVTLRAVQKAIETGRIRTSPDGKIDPAIADKMWEASTDPSKQRETPVKSIPEAGVARDNYARARADRENYNAKLSQLNYENLSGRLVDAATVRLRAFENARLVRDNLLNIPNRIAAGLASETDPAKIHAALTLEITRALEELTGIKDQDTCPPEETTQEETKEI